MGVDLIADPIGTLVMLRSQAALIGFVGRFFPQRFFLQFFQHRPKVTVVQIEGPPVDPGDFTQLGYGNLGCFASTMLLLMLWSWGR